ncbi:Ribonuclease H-like superfamily [Sesbania bispinosa]|nr:Ribonuclease H-like superfamily [Sesbania bispinosa]
MQATQYLSEYIKAIEHLPQNAPPRNPLSARPGAIWRKPIQEVIKCNTDAAWSPASQRGALAVVARDHRGSLLLGNAKIVHTFSPLVAEALALREAVMMAYNFNWDRVVFESDNLNLIQACRGENKLALIEFIVENIRTLAAGFLYVGFAWVSRNSNRVAHEVAFKASHFSLPSNWSFSNPPWLRELLLQDLQGSSPGGP